jgi:TnpA family transposase
MEKIFQPTADEINFCRKKTKSPATRIGMLILLKVFQRLGYFPQLSNVDAKIIDFVAGCAKVKLCPDWLVQYESNDFRYRHIPVIRTYLGIKAFSENGRREMIQAYLDSLESKDDLADIINFGIETLVRMRFELPAFSTMLRGAKKTRFVVNQSSYQTINAKLSSAQKAKLEELFVTDAQSKSSFWDDAKSEPGPTTRKNMTDLASRLQWLISLNIDRSVFEDLPYSRYYRFVFEGKSLDASRMRAMSKTKRMAIAASLIRSQTAQSFDDIADMFVKSCTQMHWSAKSRLETMRQQKHAETDALVATLASITEAWSNSKGKTAKIQALDGILKGKEKEILERCESHLAYAGNNWLPFLSSLYDSRRQNFLRFLDLCTLETPSADGRLLRALKFVLKCRKSKKQFLPIDMYIRLIKPPKTDAKDELKWIPDKWWNQITGLKNRNQNPQRLNRRFFEMCAFSCLMKDLKSGDIIIEGADQYGDWRSELISEEELEKKLDEYAKRIGIPSTPKDIVAELQYKLEEAMQSADQKFPDNEYLTIAGNEITLSRLRRKPEPAGWKELDEMIGKRMPVANIPEILMDTEHWLNWTQGFGPISGHQGKSPNSLTNYIAATFCYGCNLGPTQTSRSLVGADRQAIGWVDKRHVTEDKLQDAIVKVINSYNRFSLPKFWGTGKSASADGTQWDMYEKNLLSEYHIRYGGWGGIGYYHVSDTYIALFSNFISCGVWEAVYILDGLLKNESEIQPDTLHADTQGQSEPVFGLAFFLGIKLMPRIRNWKDLTFYRPSKNSKTQHLDSLFSASINWDLIHDNFKAMLRVAVSVSQGRVSSSTILRRLSSYSGTNRMYQAFCELGRAVRTIFLLEYISDIDLRRKIQSATNISEAWNGFLQWACFGGENIGGLARDSQQKAIRYNHLVGNLVVYYNVVHLTRVLQDIALEGKNVSPECLKALSPYRTEHINRFGKYELNTAKIPDPPKFDLNLSN